MKKVVMFALLLASTASVASHATEQQAKPTFKALTADQLGFYLTTAQFITNPQLSDDFRIGYISAVYGSGVYFDRLGDDSCRPPNGTVVRGIGERVLDGLKNNIDYYGPKPAITAIFEELCGKK